MLSISRRILCLKPSDLLRTENHMQHIFRWGIGNKFRSVNKNRFTPVHHARPKEVTIPVDYFASPAENVKWDVLNEQWEVSWFENMKWNGKPFPVKKFGVVQSKQNAVEFARSISSAPLQPPPKSSKPNVFFDSRLQSWVALGGPKVRGFSATKHGHARARELAEKVTDSMEERIQKLNAQVALIVDREGKGGAPGLFQT